MKTRLFLILSILSILTMFVSVAAAPAKKGDITGLTLTGVKHEPGKGVVLKFKVEGDATQSRYSGVATISGTQFPISCQTNNSNELSCVVSGGVSQFEGKTITGQVYGFAFSATVPVKRTCDWYVVTTYSTYPGYEGYWQYSVAEENFEEFDAFAASWDETTVGTACQSTPYPGYLEYFEYFKSMP